MGQSPASPSLREGLALHEKGRFSEAATIYRQVIAREPRNAEALHLLGVAELQLRNPAAAADLIDRAASIDRRNALYLSNLGLALSQLGRFGEAIAHFDQSLAIHTNSANTQSHRGNALRSLGRHDQALAAYARALAINPSHADALNNRGAVLADLNRTSEALASFDRALAANTDHAGALANRGALLVRLNRHDEAVPDLDRAHLLDPANAAVLNNRGNAFAGIKRHDAALADFDRALSIDPQYPDAWFNRATLLFDLHRFGEGIPSVERCLALLPDYAPAELHRGLPSRSSPAEAVKPRSPGQAKRDPGERLDALLLHAECLQRLRRNQAALQKYDDILQLAPDHATALANRGHLLNELGRLDLALADYEKAMAIAPGQELLPGWRSFCKLKLCDWRNLSVEILSIREAAIRGEPVCSPAVLLAMSGDPALLRQCAESYARKHFRAGRNPLSAPSAKERIRLGYFSADFHDHATAWLTAGLFEQHDKSRFEVFAFSFGPSVRDSMRRRLEPCFERFFEIGHVSDAEAVRMARDLDLNIAIDMKGFTEGSRTQIFAERAAPIQASYLGFPGTMGASYMDYIIADEHVVPAADEKFYAEKIAWLPDSYQPNDSLHDSVISAPTRRQYDLPEQAFVFCCFNSSYKITPEIFTIWVRLLRDTPDSVLWLFGDNPEAARNLRAEAQSRGIDPERLIFAGRASHGEHLARQRLADLFLDTLPYGAHTTASDALRAGLPLLTCTGTAFQGRVATGLLHAAGMPELITGSLEEYETAALAFAQNPEKLRVLRNRLAENLPRTALFNAAAYTRNLETAFAMMWERHRMGLLPASFRIATKSFAGSPAGS